MQTAKTDHLSLCWAHVILLVLLCGSYTIQGLVFVFCFCMIYCNVPKFSDRYAWANSVDPDQTAPRVV